MTRTSVLIVVVGALLWDGAAGTWPSRHASGDVVRAADADESVLRQHLEAGDLDMILLHLRKLAAFGPVAPALPGACTSATDCTTFDAGDGPLAPHALAAALSVDPDIQAAIERESVRLLQQFHASPEGQSNDVAEAVSYLVATASGLQGRAPTVGERLGFRDILQILLAHEPVFRRASAEERRLTAELCGILAMHLADQRAQDTAASYARRVVFAALRIDVQQFDWRAFERPRPGGRSAAHRPPASTRGPTRRFA